MKYRLGKGWAAEIACNCGLSFSF